MVWYVSSLPSRSGKVTHLTILQDIMKLKLTVNSASALTPAKLEKLIKEWDDNDSAATADLISAGRGYELRSECLTKTDPLSLRAAECIYTLCMLRDEYRRRMTYSGTLKRIPA